jgi:hypothetical protein
MMALDVNALFKLSVTKGSLYYIAVQADKIVPANYVPGTVWIGLQQATTTQAVPYMAYMAKTFFHSVTIMT